MSADLGFWGFYSCILTILELVQCDHEHLIFFLQLRAEKIMEKWKKKIGAAFSTHTLPSPHARKLFHIFIPVYTYMYIQCRCYIHQYIQIYIFFLHMIIWWSWTCRFNVSYSSPNLKKKDNHSQKPSRTQKKKKTTTTKPTSSAKHNTATQHKNEQQQPTGLKFFFLLSAAHLKNGGGEGGEGETRSKNRWF